MLNWLRALWAKLFAPKPSSAPPAAGPPVVAVAHQPPVAPTSPAPMPVIDPRLPRNYLVAEAAAPLNFDRPDHDALADLLLMDPGEAARAVDAAPIGSTVRSALERAARILSDTLWSSIMNGNQAAALKSVQGIDPIWQRFAVERWRWQVWAPAPTMTPEQAAWVANP